MSYNESLGRNSNYPPMSQSAWDNAPFNFPVIPERDFEVSISQSLSKDLTVCTDKYNPEYDEEDGNTYANTDDTDWEEIYGEQHYTPLELIKMFKVKLEKELEDLKNAPTDKGIPYKKQMEIRNLKNLIEECDGWCDDETLVIEC